MDSVENPPVRIQRYSMVNPADAGVACGWIARIGQCDQRVRLEVAYRVLLQTSSNTFSPDAAAEMSVHGPRSHYITARTQMRARKSDKERVGRWLCPTTTVPQRPQPSLGYGRRVADAVKNGWRLSQPNEMPMKVPRAVRRRRMGVMQPAKNAPAALQGAQPHTREQWLAVNRKLGKCTSMPVRESDLSASVSSVERLGALQRRCSSGGVNAQTWSLAPCAGLGHDSTWKSP